MIGEPGRGVRTIIEMVGRTRLDCVLGSTAGMRQVAGRSALARPAPHRVRRPVVEQPAMTAVLTDLALESEAATVTADATGQGARRRRRRRRAGLPSARHGGVQVLDLQARTRSRLRGDGMPGRQRLHRGLSAGPSVSGTAGDGHLGGIEQCDRIGRAAGHRQGSGQLSPHFDAELELGRGEHRLLDAHLDHMPYRTSVSWAGSTLSQPNWLARSSNRWRLACKRAC